ncbi:MAG TPA: SDR family oxidoreductase [Acidimicrobiales bacterium]|nr:SDR family oxidoreductase [Acidimicrobiales bacterium]
MSGARPDPILVTGATGYIGGRLVPRLLAEGRSVRCLVRDPRRVAGRGWQDVDVIGGDVADAEALAVAMRSVDVAYYLVHSMAGSESFRDRDRELAAKFAAAASHAGVRRIVYLGGLGDPAAVRSRHLVSRHEVGEVLAARGVPVVELRAGLIVGSGSASFEMLRTLTERLPIMVMPRWVDSRCQPIGVRNVLEYLLEALDHPSAVGVYEIGGADVLTYRQMMQRYAQIRGLRRAMVTFPVPHPEWGGTFAGIVTPIPRRIAEPLVESLQTDMVVRDGRAAREFAVQPMRYEEAVELALHRMATDTIETTWASSLASLTDERAGTRELADHEGMVLERHQAVTRAPPSRVFEVICALGGDDGWPAGNWLWQARGLLDWLIGGVGMRRGRRHPRELLVGEPLDFWRVEALEPYRLVRLRAEMRLPGTAWLQFEVLPHHAGSRVQQTAFFEPRGALGHLYWYALLPFHRWIFPGLIRAICARAEARAIALPVVPADEPTPVLGPIGPTSRT